MQPKWPEAFVDAVENLAGTRHSSTSPPSRASRGDPRLWEKYPRFRTALNGNPVRIWSVAMMLEDLCPSLNTTVASSQLGRLLQLLKACGWSAGKTQLGQ